MKLTFIMSVTIEIETTNKSNHTFSMNQIISINQKIVKTNYSYQYYYIVYYFFFFSP